MNKRALLYRWRRDNPDALRAIYHRWAEKRRRKVLDFLGGKCVRCKFSDWRALQIDHIDGGGTKEGLGRRKLWSKILSGAPGYQLLCANCNWIKRYERGETVPRK